MTHNHITDMSGYCCGFAGYRVHRMKKGIKFCRYFSRAKYGTLEKALAAACKASVWLTQHIDTCAERQLIKHQETFLRETF